jgi:hypothetical protein
VNSVVDQASGTPLTNEDYGGGCTMYKIVVIIGDIPIYLSIFYILNGLSFSPSLNLSENTVYLLQQRGTANKERRRPMRSFIVGSQYTVGFAHIRAFSHIAYRAN